jgi:peptide/nickel transport system ATP-binding protein
MNLQGGAEARATNAGAPVLAINSLDISLPRGADRPFAVHGAQLRIDSGRTLCIVGESGSGKSVLARSVMGLLPRGLAVTSGRIDLDGEALITATPQRLRQLRGVRMGMVFQEPMTALNPVMRCGEQVDELLRVHTDWTAPRRRARVLEVFEQVRLPEPARIWRSYPHQLSGGQRQRIVIAMAVVLEPRLLICDEPTTALDVTTQKEILRLITDLHQRQGSAVLMITHDMGVVAEIADEVIVMRHGEMVESGPRDDVLRRARAPYTRALLAAVPRMQPPPPRPLPAGEALLSASGVTKTYSTRDWLGRRRDVAALREAALAVREGETIGVVGESGSGKSTFARCLVRLIDPSAGRIFWGHDEVQALGERRLRPLRASVQVVFQDPNRSLNPRRRVGDSLIEGAINFGATPAQARRRAADLMRMVHLPEAALARYPNEFSGGQRQRLAIARALACRPRVLVADEAVSALDVSVQAEILKLLREVQSSFGLGLVFITHDLRVAAQLCDQVIVMHQGAIVEQGRTADVYAAPRHEYTQRLLAAAPADLVSEAVAADDIAPAPAGDTSAAPLRAA